MGWNIEKHLELYTICWIKEVPKVTLTERCKVSFSIGKYRDGVYCDVVDMNACNLLSGRPWQYDVKAWHGRRENICRFVKDVINFTLMFWRGIPNQKLERLEERHSLCWIFVKIWVIFKGDEGSTCFNYEALTVERSWQGSRGPWSY